MSQTQARQALLGHRMTGMMTAEVARFLNVVPNTVRGYESSGSLPAERTATGVRIFRRPDVEAFAKRRAKKLATNPDR